MNEYILLYKDGAEEKRKGHYIHAEKHHKVLLIDNIIVAPLAELQQVKFLVKGYYQIIDLI